MDDLMMLEVRDRDLLDLGAQGLAEWLVFQDDPARSVFDLAQWLADRGVAFRLVSDWQGELPPGLRGMFS